MEHVFGAMCALFIRIEIRALDLIHLNIFIYGRDMGPISSNKSDRETDERMDGHKEAPTKQNECVNEVIFFHRNLSH